MQLLTCGKCQEEKPEDNFNWRNKTQGKRSSICKTCHKIYRRQHYLENRERYIKKARRWNEENVGQRRAAARRYIKHYLENYPCVDCGETDLLVLDFDHVRGKKINSVSQLVRSQASVACVKAEIAKCEVRCANCHRRKTARQHGHWLLK